MKRRKNAFVCPSQFCCCYVFYLGLFYSTKYQLTQSYSPTHLTIFILQAHQKKFINLTMVDIPVRTSSKRKGKEIDLFDQRRLDLSSAFFVWFVSSRADWTLLSPAIISSYPGTRSQSRVLANLLGGFFIFSFLTRKSATGTDMQEDFCFVCHTRSHESLSNKTETNVPKGSYA